MTKSASAQPKKSVERSALLIELEFVGFNCRHMLFTRLSRLLAEKDVELTRPLFSRFFLNASLRQCIANLLSHQGKGRISAERIEEALCEGMMKQLLDPKTAPLPAFLKLLKKAEQRDIVVGALSCMPVEGMKELAARVEMPDSGRNLISLADAGRCCPGIDSWSNLGKSIGIPPVRCMTLASTALSARAALSAGMRCGAITDAYTIHQDFGGCDYVFDALDDDAVKTTLDSLDVD